MHGRSASKQPKEGSRRAICFPSPRPPRPPLSPGLCGISLYLCSTSIHMQHLSGDPSPIPVLRPVWPRSVLPSRYAAPPVYTHASRCGNLLVKPLRGG
ncbi:hypothetical protein LX32DRAFT_642778 [Colletotrichum zoysiae]|uniref:Uncharacterized protein n=1 Tax=Colletotrichum zoysiae TaxID=1216348 RepID=A0AAD9HC73_9PEZI|nr:hypothetical protein LX32DRAFT_642778 [Colletotrichum zoysiae]